MDSSNELKRVACCTKIIENRSKCSGANGDFSTTYVLSKNVFNALPLFPHLTVNTLLGTSSGSYPLPHSSNGRAIALQ